MQNGINNVFKKKQLIAIRLISRLTMSIFLLMFCTTVNAEKISDLPQTLSVEEKQERLTLFRKKWASVEELLNGGEVVLHEYLVKRMNKELDKESLSNLYFAQKYNRDGGYVVYLWYINDNNYPRMSGGSKTFTIDSSKSFYDSTTQDILSDYLGKHYEIVESNLRAVNDVIGISVKVYNVEQLEYLLESPRISDFRHFGFYGTEELTF